MRVQHLFSQTLRETSADVEIESHQLLLRAGYVRQLAAGIFSLLPLAVRATDKISAVLREEMNRIGGQEITMPVVHPAEPWQKSGRWAAVDQTMVRFRDRRGHDMLLAMTHEEIVAELCATEIRSWRQLPQLVYQLQTKFRDEARARGGLIRVREFVMKDSYSLDRNLEGLQKQYEAHYDAYHRIGARLGLRLTAVQSDTGMMGGRIAHEFMYVTPIGEDTIVVCPSCGYAANREVARFQRREATPEAAVPLERVATPGAESIAEVGAALGVAPHAIAKACFFVASQVAPAKDRLVVALVRGDSDVNETKVGHVAGAIGLRPAHPEEIRAAGMEPGYGSPIGLASGKALVIADPYVTGANLVMGANEAGFHVRGARSGRDYQVDHTAEIALAGRGDPCGNCGQPLELSRAVEVGNIFQLGTRYSDASGATFLDETGRAQPIIMGSYGIGVGRLLACIAEEHRDEKGLKLPITAAPFDVALVALGKEPETGAEAERAYAALQDAGLTVLFDDRDLGAGVKFADADLRGLPIRVVVSDRSRKQNSAELTVRATGESRMVPLPELAAAVRALAEEMRAACAAAAESAPRWTESAIH